MTYTILDGKKISEKIYAKISERTAKMGKKPRLDIIIVGDDYASQKYVSMKEKTAHQIGFDGIVHQFPADAIADQITNKIKELNSDNDINGFMIQLPMPAHLDSQKLVNLIDPAKDVDGLTDQNLGRLFANRPYLNPATAQGVIRLLEEYNINVEGKNAVVIGKSAIVGMPIAGLLMAKNATVTVCHSKTVNTKEIASKTDILVSATGVAHLVKEDWVKEGAIVIDVGIEKDPKTGKLVGDVDFDNVAPKCSYITPVPGGTGPMTIACLMENGLKTMQNQEGQL